MKVRFICRLKRSEVVEVFDTKDLGYAAEEWESLDDEDYEAELEGWAADKGFTLVWEKFGD